MTKIPFNIKPGKTWYRIINVFVVLFVIIPFLSYAVLRSPKVQTYVTSLITNYLQKELKTKIEIGGVDISPGLDVILENVFMADRSQDTLLYTQALRIDVGRFNYKRKILHVSNLSLSQGVVRLIRPQNDSSFNYQFLIDYFSPSDTTKTKTDKLWNFRVHAVDVRNTRFSYHVEGRKAPESGMDYNNLVFSDISIDLSNIRIAGDTLYSRINRISANEKCGFHVENMSGEASIAPDRWQIDKLKVKTDLSMVSMETLNLGFKSIRDFNDFILKVKLEATINPSVLHSADIVYFAPELAGMNEKVDLHGNVKGTIAQLRLKDFIFDYGTHTHFRGNVRLNGLPVIEETFILLDAKELVTHPDDIAGLSLPGGGKITIPEQIAKFGKVSVKGNFTGFYNDFVSYANFQTALGGIKTDLSVKNDAQTGKISYQGKLNSSGFELGQLINLPANVGKLNLTSEITGSGLTLDELDIRLNGIVDSLYLQGNVYRMLTIDGDVQNKRFTGQLAVRDQTIDLDLDGYADFSTNSPSFNFISSIRHANLNRLKLIQSDTTFVLNTDLMVHLSGIQPDSMYGNLTVDKTALLMNRSVYKMEQLTLDLKPIAGIKYIDLHSDFLDLNLKASTRFSDAPRFLGSIINRYFPSIKTKDQNPVELPPDQWIDFNLTLRNTGILSKVFAPGILLSKNASISGLIRNGDTGLAIDGEFPGVMLNSTLLKSIHFGLRSENNQLLFNSKFDHILFNDSIGMDSLVLTAGIGNDSIHFFLNWNNEEKTLKNKGDFQGIMALTEYPKLTLNLLESEAYINDSLWRIPETNTIIFHNKLIQVQNLTIHGNDEIINLNGLISDNPMDHMILDMQNFNLDNLDLLTRSIDFNFNGLMSGRIDLSNIYQSPNLISSIHIKNLVVNDDKLGDADIVTVWDPATAALSTKAEVIYKGNIGENKPIAIQGFYYPQNKDSSLDFTIEVVNFKLKTISNFLSSFSSDFTGRANGKIRLLGTLKKPSLVGTIAVNRAELMVDYLNVSYSFSHDVRFDKNLISVDNMTVYDSIGNKSVFNAKIKHNYFKDFDLDIDIQPEKLLALNTDFIQNELFYGTAFATGKVRIFGPVTNLKMDITATTNKGTDFYVPINTANELGNNNFITFVQPKKQDSTAELFPEYKADFSGIGVNLDLRATQDAWVKIFMPEGLGNISANGEGNIRMNVNTRGEFDIYGVYEIMQGDFNFTLQNVIQRHFNIQQGSKIIFNGSPYDAQVDINANYKIDVPLSGLNAQAYNADLSGVKVPVSCVIDLKGSLFNPDILFKLRLSNNNPDINRVVYSQIDTNNQQQMAEQMIFLLVLRQFKPLDRTNNITIGNSVGSSSWELVSNQLSNWLSQISKDFDVGVNYKPGDKLTSDEISVALSTQLFNERLIIDGNIGVQGNNTPAAGTNQNPSNIVGDVNVEFKLTRDGRFRVKAYNRSNNTVLIENNSPYTQGLGLFYRKEFDYFSDLFKRKNKQPLKK